MAEPSKEALERQPETKSVGFLSRVSKLSPLAVLVTAMLLLGLFLRVNAFGYPNTFMFDEHHFVENARNYLLHKPDQNDHPPIGKMIIAQSIGLLGDTPVAWRLPSLIWGFITIIAVGFAAGRLFSSAQAGWLAAAFIGVDGFLSGYSRAALLDGFLAGSLALMFCYER
jgi:dolichyl-phosphate-mannose-protein mannosyltransferase